MRASLLGSYVLGLHLLLICTRKSSFLLTVYTYVISYYHRRSLLTIHYSYVGYFQSDILRITKVNVAEKSSKACERDVFMNEQLRLSTALMMSLDN